uniref:Homeobox domain-containing protein n=1 Tax=Panagrellus redivivus TaxID=6233 RepID=A0A7E4W666_PANRE
MQVHWLETEFRCHRYVSPERRAGLAAILGLSQQQVSKFGSKIDDTKQNSAKECSKATFNSCRQTITKLQYTRRR